MVYAYIRVSTKLQCCDNQKFELKQWCRAKQIHVDRWVEESVSGTKSYEDRLLGSTLKEMSKGDLLICTEISRLGRSMLMIMSILNTCASSGIRIRTIKDNFDLSDSINSKIIAFAFALTAEIERNLISQRTREALASKKAMGIRLGRPSGSSSKEKRMEENMPEIIRKIDLGYSVAFMARTYGLHQNTLKKYIINYRNRLKR